MSRLPTDRDLAWLPWRQRVAGASDVPLHISEPQPGLYRRKQFGRWVAVQIDLEREIDTESGELVGDEIMVAFVNGERTTDVLREWSYCADNPIDEREFKRLRGMPAVFDLSRSVII